MPPKSIRSTRVAFERLRAPWGDTQRIASTIRSGFSKELIVADTLALSRLKLSVSFENFIIVGPLGRIVEGVEEMNQKACPIFSRKFVRQFPYVSESNHSGILD